MDTSWPEDLLGLILRASCRIENEAQPGIRGYIEGLRKHGLSKRMTEKRRKDLNDGTTWTGSSWMRACGISKGERFKKGDLCFDSFEWIRSNILQHTGGLREKKKRDGSEGELELERPRKLF
jgi:hypothetical protein